MNTILFDSDPATLTELSNRIGRAVRDELPPGCHFVVLFFDDTYIGQYVSNAHRGDIIKVMLETADRLLSEEDVPR